MWGFVCLQIITFAYLNMQNTYGNVALFYERVKFFGGCTDTNTYTIPHKALKLCGLITEKESNKVGKFSAVYWP